MASLGDLIHGVKHESLPTVFDEGCRRHSLAPESDGGCVQGALVRCEQCASHLQLLRNGCARVSNWHPILPWRASCLVHDSPVEFALYEVCSSQYVTVCFPLPPPTQAQNRIVALAPTPFLLVCIFHVACIQSRIARHWINKALQDVACEGSRAVCCQQLPFWTPGVEWAKDADKWTPGIAAVEQVHKLIN
jgi:hypothetical protein